jgi:hypothetical protein
MIADVAQPGPLAAAITRRKRGRQLPPSLNVPEDKLAQALANLAPSRPLGAKSATLPRGNMQMLDEATGNDGELRRSYQRQRQVWSIIGRQVPGKVMPAPDLLPKDQSSAYGTFRQPGEPAGWVSLPGTVSRRLVEPVDAPDEYGQKTQRYYKSAALQTLLHEWAHALQNPGLAYDPGLAEGGADAYGQVMRPMVARELGMPDDTTPLAYPKQTRRTLERKGLHWALRGQFR